jgi:precorrin-3B synthase
MESGDGLIVRVRITGGIVPAATVAAIGQLARRHGNGLIDLSQRANLQIRGVRGDTLDRLTADLDALGLLDADPAAESVRNVIGPPMAGLDPAAPVDGVALVRALEARLAGETDLHALPDKFGFVVDDGGAVPLDDVAGDIRLVGSSEGVHLAVGGDGASAAAVGLVPADRAADAALALARAFLDLRVAHGARRMRALVADIGADAVREAAGLPAPGPAVPRGRQRPVLVGAADGYAGVAAPFGRFTADQVDVLAAAAGPQGVRLTPWRLVLLPGRDGRVLTGLSDAGLIVEADDPRRAVVACPGRPDCPSGAVDTRVAAAALAPLARGAGGIVLHVSGCPKGCARPGPTAVTLTGRDGAFDLVVDGRADGTPIRSRLDLAAARAAVDDVLAGLRDPA